MRRPIAKLARPTGCTCPEPLRGPLGAVLKGWTCPVCSALRLEVMKGREYAGAYVKGGDTEKLVLLKQKEFFRL